jgi:hypothetical protein
MPRLDLPGDRRRNEFWTLAEKTRPMSETTPQAGCQNRLRRRLISALTLPATAAIAAAAAATLFVGHGSALAPEPAKLIVKLDGVTGYTAAGVYVNTATPTRIAYWGSSWIMTTYGPPAGTPCSAYALPEGTTTRQVMQVYVTASGAVLDRERHQRLDGSRGRAGSVGPRTLARRTRPRGSAPR